MSVKKSYLWVGLSSVGLICLVSAVLQKDYAILGKDIDSSTQVEQSKESTTNEGNSSEKNSSDNSTSISQTTNTESKTSGSSVSSASSSTTSTSVSESSTTQSTQAPTSSSEKPIIEPPVVQPKEEKVQKLDQHLPSQVDEQAIEENYQGAVVKHQSTQNFIDVVKDSAQEVAWNNDLYASVMLAQAILETGSGNSALSRPPYHNLFGIKGSYKGKSVSFATQEQLKTGQAYTIQAKFRRYPDFKASFSDYAVLLKDGIDGNPTFYQKTWKSKTNSYKDATAFLTGRYATDTKYDKKLNDLIEVYGLTKYDQKPGEHKKKSGYHQFPRIVNRIDELVLLTESEKDVQLKEGTTISEVLNKKENKETTNTTKEKKKQKHKKKSSVMDQQIKDISGNQKVESNKGILANE